MARLLRDCKIKRTVCDVIGPFFRDAQEPDAGPHSSEEDAETVSEALLGFVAEG